MVLAFKDASDFKGRTVNENLANQVINMDNLAGVNDINVANHANAFNGVASGAECWYYAGDSVGKELAEKVSKAIADALGIPNRGAKPTTSLYVISQSVGHTILPEWFFIDNPNDVAKWNKYGPKAIDAVMKVFESYPEYNFKTTHGGHYGLNMMDPGAVGNGLKEAVVMQEVNKAMLAYKSGSNNTGNTGGGNTVTTNKFKHSVRIWWFAANSNGLKSLVKYVEQNGWKYEQVKGEDGRIRLEVKWFTQNSSNKHKLTDYVESQGFNYDIKSNA